MNKSLQTLGLLLFLLVINCEDKQSKSNQPESKTTNKTINQPEAEIDSSEIENALDSTKSTQNKRQNPILNEDNAMEFFLQYDKKHKEDKVRITTDFGTIDIKLYDETKFHRSNFIYLTKRGYFNDTQFYRVVDNFIIQGGNTDDIEVKRKRDSIGRYLLPVDNRHGFKHHRGVISMPSSEIANPHKLASPYEFFIVQSPTGSYHLDGDYTAFGRVINGMDTVDKIAAQKTDKAEWPLHNIYIRKVEIID